MERTRNILIKIGMFHKKKQMTVCGRCYVRSPGYNSRSKYDFRKIRKYIDRININELSTSL